MSKKLTEDQEKFSTLAEDLERLSKEQRPLTDEQLQMSNEILGQYKEQLSVAGIRKFFKVWEADTPEEAEVVEICKAVM